MSSEFDLGVRIQALTLHSQGYARAQICKITGYSPGGLTTLIAKAKKRGYKPGGGRILAEYATEGLRKGRPAKLTPAKKDQIVRTLESDNTLRGKTTKEIADIINKQNPADDPVSQTTIWRALKEKGFKSVKYTTKPGLHYPEEKRYRLV